jgi:hypothetical protein
MYGIDERDTGPGQRIRRCHIYCGMRLGQNVGTGGHRSLQRELEKYRNGQLAGRVSQRNWDASVAR